MFRVPVMTSCSSCLDQTFTRIITLAPFFFVMLDVVLCVCVCGRGGRARGSVFTVYLLHARTVWKLCVGKSPCRVTVRGSAVCGARYSSVHLTLNAQVPHHYLIEPLSSFIERVKALTVLSSSWSDRGGFKKKLKKQWCGILFGSPLCTALLLLLVVTNDFQASDFSVQS